MLEKEFTEAMLDIYRRAKKECNYNATRFLNMVNENGGLETARILIHTNDVSDGYIALWENQRMDLTVEAVILNDRWKPLFTEEELNIARKRLMKYGYKF